jgi:SAM-dependent methyltransferase
MSLVTPVTPVMPVDEVFAHALRGEPTYVVTAGVDPIRLPVDDWTRTADAADRALVALCRGATLDIGCGPGRLTAELTARGHVALGIDLVHESVHQTIRRGGAALRRDVFGPVPGEGRWRTALLADGNIGIGGDPGALLLRTRRLLARHGRIVVEVAPPGVGSRRVMARLVCACSTSAPFPWAVVGADDVPRLAAGVGLVEADRIRVGDRWAVVLREPR